MNITLLGDSQVLRLLNTWQATRRTTMPNSLAQSGITAQNLKIRLRSFMTHLHQVVFLLIGLNDILQKRPLPEIKQDIKSILHNIVRTKRTVMVATLPLTKHNNIIINQTILSLNKYIRTFHHNPRITVLDFQKIFSNNNHHDNLYQNFYHDGRPDRIHFSSAAHHILIVEITEFVERLQNKERN